MSEKNEGGNSGRKTRGKGKGKDKDQQEQEKEKKPFSLNPFRQSLLCSNPKPTKKKSDPDLASKVKNCQDRKAMLQSEVDALTVQVGTLEADAQAWKYKKMKLLILLKGGDINIEEEAKVFLESIKPLSVDYASVNPALDIDDKTPNGKIMLPSLGVRFKINCERVRAKKLKSPTDPDKFNVYALYKQATVGDCNTPEPVETAIKEHSKWKAWSENKGMSKEAAMLSYVDIVEGFMKTIEHQ